MFNNMNQDEVKLDSMTFAVSSNGEFLGSIKCRLSDRTESPEFGTKRGPRRDDQRIFFGTKTKFKAVEIFASS